MYAKNAGITGNMHGARNDPSPANAATATVISAILKTSLIFYLMIVPNCFQFDIHFYLAVL
jgi:hypothetical protein